MKRTKTTPGYLTWIEAAEEFGICTRTLKKLAAEGKLKRYRQHGRRETLLARDELDAVLRPCVVSA